MRLIFLFLVWDWTDTAPSSAKRGHVVGIQLPSSFQWSTTQTVLSQINCLHSQKRPTSHLHTAYRLFWNHEAELFVYPFQLPSEYLRSPSHPLLPCWRNRAPLQRSTAPTSNMTTIKVIFSVIASKLEHHETLRVELHITRLQCQSQQQYTIPTMLFEKGQLRLWPSRRAQNFWDEKDTTWKSFHMYRVLIKISKVERNHSKRF